PRDRRAGRLPRLRHDDRDRGGARRRPGLPSDPVPLAGPPPPRRALMQQTLDSVMLRTMLGPLVSSLQLFAAYVLIHGHYSPGGGFQSGVVLGASFILPLLVLGRGARSYGYSVLTRGQGLSLSAIGVLIFVAVATAPVFL